MTPEIDAMLDGHGGFSFPTTEAEIKFGIFCAGQLLTLSAKKTKQRPDMERLEGHDEVWAICVRTPKPGWRLLGRWFRESGGQYVFVVLRAWDKTELYSQYAAAAAEVIDDWNQLFPGVDPQRAADLGDYLGGSYYDLDKP